MSTYVYGFTHATHPLVVGDLAGVGSQRLRVLSSGGLAAVVSGRAGGFTGQAP